MAVPLAAGFSHFNGPDMLRTVDNTPSSSLRNYLVEKSYEEYSWLTNVFKPLIKL